MNKTYTKNKIYSRSRLETLHLNRKKTFRPVNIKLKSESYKCAVKVM